MLLSYQGLRDEITRKILEDRSRLERGEMSADEMRGLLSDLLREREMVVEEVDDLREQRYGWVSEARSYRDSMKLMLSELDEKTYNDLESASSRLGVSAGRLLNEMMNKAVDKGCVGGEFPDLSSADISHLKKGEEIVIKINHIKNLTVSEEDLDVETRVQFSHIASLEFDSTVDEGRFWNKIKEINHCQLVKLPSSLSKLLVFAKSRFCGNYEFI